MGALSVLSAYFMTGLNRRICCITHFYDNHLDIHASVMSHYDHEVRQGRRFEFGVNWSRFLSVLSDERIQNAEDSLRRMLGVSNLRGKSFLDIGSGSGLFSLAARRLGARVHSFDYDPKSVNCTAELRRRYFPDDPEWTVEEGSVLDAKYLQRLGQFDVVYSWGVLHHTGAMWQALANVKPLVVAGGVLFISIYNDQGDKSRLWRLIKRQYNNLPGMLKLPFALIVIGPREVLRLLYLCLKGRPMSYFNTILNYSHLSSRGMSYWHDKIDWVGGYPFEVAKPEEIFSFYHAHGFLLEQLKTCGGGLGCNEYIFKSNVS